MEVMVALAIMSVAVVAVFQLYSQALRTTKKAEDTTRAIFYARSMLDEAYSLADLSDASASKEYEQYFKADRRVVVLSESKDRKTRVYEITVSVTWPPKGNYTIKGIRSVDVSEEQ